MAPDLRWLASQSASSLHAVEAVRRGIAPSEPRIAAAIAEPADRLIGEARTYGLEGDRFWEHLLPLSADIDNDQELELVTGKRYRAHNGNDPGADNPVGVYYFEINSGDFQRVTLDYGPPDRASGQGRPGYKLNGNTADLEPDSDIQALKVDRIVSVTPLSLDLTSRIGFGTLYCCLRAGQTEHQPDPVPLFLDALADTPMALC